MLRAGVVEKMVGLEMMQTDEKMMQTDEKMMQTDEKMMQTDEKMMSLMLLGYSFLSLMIKHLETRLLCFSIYFFYLACL
jgi:hypothetical protein